MPEEFHCKMILDLKITLYRQKCADKSALYPYVPAELLLH